MASQEPASPESQGSVLDEQPPSSPSAVDSRFSISSAHPLYRRFPHSIEQSEPDDTGTAPSTPIAGSYLAKRRQSEVSANWGYIFVNQHPKRSQSPASCDENDLSTENEIPLFNVPAEDMPTLDPRHEFAKYTDELAIRGQREFLQVLFVDKGSSKRPKERTLSAQARKRLKLADFETYMAVEQSNAPDDDEIVIVRRPKHILACQFYKRNPTKYLSCLTRADIRSVSDLAQHLWNSHRRPHFCPACFKEFETALVCDNHIRERSCSVRQAPQPDGLSEEQIQELSLLVITPEITEVELWSSMWNIAFPKEQAHTPYLSGELESVICDLRRFWSERGEGLIAEFLEKQKLQHYNVRNEERNLRALHRVVLEQMIDKLASLRDDENMIQGSTRSGGIFAALRRIFSGGIT